MVESEATGPEPDATAASGNPAARRRSPVTIDLSATPVEPVEAQSPRDGSEPIADNLANAPDPEPILADEPPSPPGSQDKGGAFPLIGGVPFAPLTLAAGVGAIAALLIAFLAATAGLVSTPASRNATAALARIEKLASDLSIASTNETRVSTEVQAVSARLAGVETMARDLLTTTEQLRGLDSTAASNEALINQLAAQVSDLRATIKSMATADPSAPGNGAEMAALSARLDEVSARLSALGDKPVTDARTAAAARTMAFAGLRAAAERGEPFGEALRLLSMLGVEGSLLAPLESAKDGVPSRGALSAEFDAVERVTILASDTAEPDTGLFWRVVHRLGSVVTIRPAGPVAGTTPAAIVSRMRAAVDSGDLEAALREREGLPDPGKAASENWARQVNARVALDKSVAGLAGAIETAAAGQ